MKTETFKAELEPIGPGDALTCVRIPFSVKHVFGTDKRLEVSAALNGVPFESALEAEGDGTHTMLVDQAALRAANVHAGQVVEIRLQVK